MAILSYEDAYCLGLLYAYVYSNRKMVLKSDLNRFYELVMFNLISKENNSNERIILDSNEPSIYFESEGKNGEIYYVLDPRIDLTNAYSKYIGSLPLDVVVASQKENTLRAIDLKKVNGNIVKRTPNEITLSNTDFMKNAKGCEIEKSDDYKRIREEEIKTIKEERNSSKLDFKTWLYLQVTQAKCVEHPAVEQVNIKKTLEIENINKNEVYVFRNYEEYKKYFLMYLDDVDEELIDLAIYTRGSNGHIIALKGLCEQIIVNKIKINSVSQEQGPIKKLVPNNKK